MAFGLKNVTLFLLVLSCFFSGDSLASTAYNFTDLRPGGSSQYEVPERKARREYFHFQNALGSHRFIYEEAPGITPLSGMEGMRDAAGKKGIVCSVDLDCLTPAFCTGRCRNMYYELSNSPGDPALKERNHCTVTSFKCQKEGGGDVR